jgi:hypothetical protein
VPRDECGTRRETPEMRSWGCRFMLNATDAGSHPATAGSDPTQMPIVWLYVRIRALLETVLDTNTTPLPHCPDRLQTTPLPHAPGLTAEPCILLEFGERHHTVFFHRRSCLHLIASLFLRIGTKLQPDHRHHHVVHQS